AKSGDGKRFPSPFSLSLPRGKPSLSRVALKPPDLLPFLGKKGAAAGFFEHRAAAKAGAQAFS
ncbi:hypothetical protein, partial [Francisella tularensis]|uniref:hypothetical protein n=1 Tax=Francisella tularensis TaxID=263 RepID=UPI001F48E0CF